MRCTLFHIYFRFQVAIFNFSTTLTSLCTNIRPTMLFDAKDMRIHLKIHKYSIYNVRFKCFWFYVRHFDFRWTRIELCTGCCCDRSGDFGILKNKRSNVEFAFKGDLRPLIPWSPSLSHFHQNHPHHLHFRWCNCCKKLKIAERHLERIWSCTHSFQFN